MTCVCVCVFVQNKDVALTVFHLGQEESGDAPNPPLNSSTGIRLCTGIIGCDIKTAGFRRGEVILKNEGISQSGGPFRAFL